MGSKEFIVMRKSLLNSGIPCKRHGCIECCVETRMPLTRFDIDKISSQGYRLKDYITKRKGERYLKNRNGRCVFLENDGCTIYTFRPEGCQLYPLMYNEYNGRYLIHEFCLHGSEFKVTRKDKEKLDSLISKLDKKY